MALVRRWAGKVFGTNTGNIFAQFEGEDSALKGTLRHRDSELGVNVVYDLAGNFNGSKLEFEGAATTKIEGVEFGKLKGAAILQPNGSLEGDWQSDNGAGGTFVLFPHDRPQAPAEARPPDQMHSARHNFGPIEIDRGQIIALAEDIQKGFTKSRVVVTVITGTEQSRFLEDFKQVAFSEGQAELVKLFIREPDPSGIDRSITVEFGPSVNWAMAQGVNEAWALGERERLKRDIKKFERRYAGTNVGTTFNQLMLLCTVVFLPSLPGLWERAVLMAGVVALAFVVNKLNQRHLPHAAIYLSARKVGWFVRFLPSAFAWITGILASVAATILGIYLKGWLPLPVMP